MTDAASRPPEEPATQEAGASLTPVRAVSPDAVALRILASVDRWKRRLLDLTKRNRGLNFRPTRVSTVAIVDEHPAEVFRLLGVEEVALRFRATKPPAERREVGRPDSDDVDSDLEWTADPEGEVKLPATAGFAPYDRSDLDPSQTDRVLQAFVTPEQLDRSLRRLDEQARLSIEEMGVNTLFMALGMLHYREAQDSEETFRAPLILLPVELERRSARVGYAVSATDDDPIVNPALAEYLRLTVGLELPELPPLGEEGSDVQPWLSKVVDVISGQPGWEVTNDVFLALFAFQKLVMYKDLEVHAPACAQHRLIRQLVSGGGRELGLPDDVRELDLDREYPPERTVQVVDADSSQLRAIATMTRGYDLVIDGPPGTGKSQTITNLIAQAVADGRSVLFVAEKKAALDVVHRRLVQAGLGECCLELHSTKANKRAVIKQLADALDASLQQPAVQEVSAQRLSQVRDELTQYVKAVHEPYGGLAWSPYRVYGELGRVREAPRVAWPGAVEPVTTAQLAEVQRDLRDLAQAASVVGNPSEHPWRDAQRQYYSESDLDRIRELIPVTRSCLGKLQTVARDVETLLGLPVKTFTGVDRAVQAAEVLGRSPGAPAAVLLSTAWDRAPAEVVALVERGKRLSSLKREVLARFNAEVLDRGHADDIAFVRAKLESQWSFLARLDGRYREVARRWKEYRRSIYEATLPEQAKQLEVADVVRAERQALAQAEGAAKAAFGGHWRGEQSDWKALEGYVAWVVEFRRVAQECDLGAQAAQLAEKPRPTLPAVSQLQVAAEALRLSLGELREVVGWPSDYLGDVDFTAIDGRLTVLGEGLSLAPRWATFEAARARVVQGLAADLLAPAVTGQMPFASLSDAFLRAFYQKWLDTVVQLRPALRAFHTLSHEQRVVEFRALDRAVLQTNRTKVIAGRREALQRQLRSDPSCVEAMTVLRKELARQRGHAPLRVTVQRAEAAIRAIKPCFLMSPLTVAQYLRGADPSFDLVIFDEASQLPPEDSVGAIVRGRQLVVVGDPKQLPPTNFFTTMLGQPAAVDEEGMPIYEDTESVLEQFSGAGIARTRLRWHYRSVHESLIAFSNVSFYDADLHTFPSIETDSDLLGLQFVFVPDGVYEGKGLNQAEARRVADAVVEHVKRHPDLSLGVGTFNLRQQLAILDELEARRRADPSIEFFFSRSGAEPLFVKNLENIQGDERDVILISVTYAKGHDGRLRYNFGPLNSQNGWRRLNVLITRARRRMRVFASIKAEDINPTATSSEGPRLLRDFLLYAERGRLDSPTISARADAESPFEREVLSELTRQGLRLQPQVGVAGYRIDFGVLDDVAQGRFLCGIECDGVAYHNSETARDRDRLRQEVLEARGWIIHRVWSTDWFKDRAGQVERLLRLIEETKVRVREALEAEVEAKARADADEQAASPAERPDEGGQGALGTEEGRSERASSGVLVDGASPYRMAQVKARYIGQEILDAPWARLTDIIREVAMVETPLHVADLSARVADVWGVGRVGSRIAAKLQEALRRAAASDVVEVRGDFVWMPGRNCAVRSRVRNQDSGRAHPTGGVRGSGTSCSQDGRTPTA